MPITRTRDDDGVATLVMDDGKANAFDLDVFAELNARLDECAADAAVVVCGRPDMFSGGLNMKVMNAADDAALTELLATFGRTMLRLWLEPRPVVAAATGHAIAGGTILAMACDHVVAADGDFRWGLPETTIGFPIPEFVLTLARGNVPADHLDDLVLSGTLVSAGAAVSVGFADEIADPDDVVSTAHDRARTLVQLPLRAYASTKARLRAAEATAALDHLEADITALLEERASSA
jgi:enoyl-CoA hydratase